MLLALRILFPLAFVLCLLKGAALNGPASAAWDVNSLFYAALALFTALGTGLAWAPYVGEKIAEPLTSILTSGEAVEGENHLVKLINALLKRGWRRTALWLCFAESLRHAHAPAAPWIGLKSSKAGSWLEREFAWMVYRFNHAQHCVEAWRILKRHGIQPPQHHDPMVQLFIQADEQPPNEPRASLMLQPAPPPPRLRRDPRIRLFEIDEGSMSLTLEEREAAVASMARVQEASVSAVAPETADTPRTAASAAGFWARLRSVLGRLPGLLGGGH